MDVLLGETNNYAEFQNFLFRFLGFSSTLSWILRKRKDYNELELGLKVSICNINGNNQLTMILVNILLPR